MGVVIIYSTSPGFSQRWAIYFAAVFIPFFIFNDLCTTNYLNIYLTHLYGICRVCTNIAVD